MMKYFLGLFILCSLNHWLVCAAQTSLYRLLDPQHELYALLALVQRSFLQPAIDIRLYTPTSSSDDRMRYYVREKYVAMVIHLSESFPVDFIKATMWRMINDLQVDPITKAISIQNDCNSSSRLNSDVENQNFLQMFSCIKCCERYMQFLQTKGASVNNAAQERMHELRGFTCMHHCNRSVVNKEAMNAVREEMRQLHLR